MKISTKYCLKGSQVIQTYSIWRYGPYLLSQSEKISKTVRPARPNMYYRTRNGWSHIYNPVLDQIFETDHATFEDNTKRSQNILYLQIGHQQSVVPEDGSTLYDEQHSIWAQNRKIIYRIL